MKLSIQILLLVVLLFISCNSISKSKLIGQWQAVSLSIENTLEEIDLSSVGFEFLKDGSYNYNGTLKYKEAGFFDLKNDLLFTIDTLNSGTSEKTVKILSLSNDSLSIQMVENNLNRVLKLVRKN